MLNYLRDIQTRGHNYQCFYIIDLLISGQCSTTQVD